MSITINNGFDTNVTPNYGPDVTRMNPVEFIYLKGDEKTDGSLRLKPDITGAKFEFQMRAGGEWNDTDIQVASASIFVGKDLELSAGGKWLETNSININETALVPHIVYNEFGTFSTHAPVLGKQVIHFVSEAGESSEMVGKNLNFDVINPPFEVLVSQGYWKTGSVAATQSIQITFRRGGPSGPIFFQHNFPPSLMADVGQEFIVPITGLVSGDPLEVINISFTSLADLSMKTDGAGTPWTAIDYWPAGTEDVLVDNLILAEDTSLLFAEDASLIVTKTFPV